MNLSINGHSQVPPGFRFHPTEEELLHYYLRKKVSFEKIDLDVIREVDLNKLEPWDIQEKCRIGSTPQNDWYFFSHKDKKYPTGTRTNRATAVGFWKATGRDKIIYSGCTRIGLRKTLVFYKGRAPHGQKSDWIMHEYRLDDNTNHDTNVVLVGDSSAQEEGWVVCRVFKKKNYQKAIENPRATPSPSMEAKLTHMNTSGVLDQILVYMGRTCKMENHEPLISHNMMGSGSDGQERFVRLPRLESPSLSSQLPMITASSSPFDQTMMTYDDQQHSSSTKHVSGESNVVNDWAAFDRLVASQLNGQEGDTTSSRQQQLQQQQLSSCFGSDQVMESSYVSCVNVPNRNETSESSQVAYNYSGMSESDFWSFTKSLSSSTSALDPLCHLSV